MSALLGYLLIANLAAFAAMGWDKSSARRGVQRVPERTLLTLAVAGGGLGAVLAQQMFRHKTRKQPFANILVAIFAAQAMLAIVLLARGS